MKARHSIGSGSDRSRVYVSDAIQTILRAGRESPDLIFMDPPFNIDVQYPGGKRDKMPAHEYAKWIRELTAQSLRAVRDDGIVIVHLPDRHIADVASWAYSKVDHPEWCAGLNIRVVNWVVWRYGFGQCPTGTRIRYTPSKAHALILSPGRGSWTFGRAGLVESERSKLGDSRTKRRSSSSVVPPGMKPREDVIDCPRIVGNARERRPKHPNQLPELYMAQLLATYSRAGDLVVDPFCGSGTTATVARALGRRSITGDISTEIADSAAERIRTGPFRAAEIAEIAALG